MRKSGSGIIGKIKIGIISLGIAIGGLTPATSAPTMRIAPEVMDVSLLQLAQADRRHQRPPHANRPNRPNRPGAHNRPHRPNVNRPHRPSRPHAHRPRPNRPGYWNGHRGSRTYRRGWRRHSNGWWFPMAAFTAGAVIAGSANQPQRVYVRPARHLSDAHLRWCHNRWRSFRASDNTFQPYNGPRRQCVSPYM